jgi:hypothetical protein
MGLDVRYLTYGFTIVILNTEYIDKKTFFILNIPHLTSLMKAAILKLFGPSIHSITNPQNLLHYQLSENEFLLTQNAFADLLENQYHRFDILNISEGIRRVIKQASNAESNVGTAEIIMPKLDEQVAKIENRLIYQYGPEWKENFHKEITINARFLWSRRIIMRDHNLLSSPSLSTISSRPLESD